MFSSSNPPILQGSAPRWTLRAWLAAGAAAVALLAGCASAPEFDERGMDRHDPAGDPVIADAIAARIAGRLDEPTALGAPSLIELRHRGQRVWLHIAACCDRLNHLYDDQGRRLCAPSGGLDGRGDGRCPEVQVPAGWRVGRSEEMPPMRLPQPQPAARSASQPS